MEGQEGSQFSQGVLPLPQLSKDNNFPSFSQSIDELVTRYVLEEKKMQLPVFQKDRPLCIFSDYGGEHKESPHNTYTFLFCEYDPEKRFSTDMRRIRKTFGLDDPFKEIAFKDLRYGPLSASIDDILKAADESISGLLVSIIVEKDLVMPLSLNVENAYDSLIRELEETFHFSKWKRGVLAKMLYIAHTIGYFVKLLSSKDQRLFWVTDQDSTMGSAEQMKRCVEFVYAVIDDYGYPDLVSEFGYLKPGKMGPDAHDFGAYLGLADLIAGSFADYFQSTEKYGVPGNSKESAAKIMTFTGTQGKRLKKMSFLFNNAANGGFLTTLLQLVPMVLVPAEICSEKAKSVQSDLRSE